LCSDAYPAQLTTSELGFQCVWFVEVSDTPFSLTSTNCMMLLTRRSSKISLPKPPAIAHFSGQPFLTFLVLYLKTSQPVPNYPLPDPDLSCVISSESASDLGPTVWSPLGLHEPSPPFIGELRSSRSHHFVSSLSLHCLLPFVFRHSERNTPPRRIVSWREVLQSSAKYGIVTEAFLFIYGIHLSASWGT
jgi:hypothetical protein